LIVAAVAGAAVLELVGAAIGDALSTIGDFMGTLLGVTPQFPCNGLVFSDAVPFTGGALEVMPSTEHGRFSATQEATFTRSHTDETTHDSNICGHIAETDVTFSISRLPFLSVRTMAFFVFGVRSNPELKDGLRGFGVPRAGTTLTIDMFSDKIKGSLRSLLLAQSAANARGTLATS
jgi:hypothetical protein